MSIVVRSRRLSNIALAAMLVGLLVFSQVLANQPSPPPLAWLSGASGVGVADGTFGAWRGRPVQVAGTWNDNLESQAEQWTLRSGFELGDWDGPVDDAVGAIFKDRGETWAAAATGAYDERWRTMLTNLSRARAGRSGTLFLRFAHELNGDWYPWSVTAAEASDFKEAWSRFRSIQVETLPQAQLVFCVNAETSGALGLDWRDAFPGRDLVDVMAVDYYNQFPFVDDTAGFRTALGAVDQWGAPRGLERHREFARSVGLPFAIPEWSSNAGQGDSPAFVRGFKAWLDEHAGTAPGEVLYEIQFNVAGYDGDFQLHPDTSQPRAASTYTQLW